MDYEIFINYRREGGQEYARPLALELEKRGYRVFLDFDELKDGKFDKRIMEAIDSAPIFISILSPNCLERCVNADDWVRQEIEYAFEREKHIIPVNPDRLFDGFPETTPARLRQALGQHQFSEIMMGMLYKSSMDKMVEDRIVPILGRRNEHGATSQTAAQGLLNAVLKIDTDLDCRVFVDGEEKGTATAGEVKRVNLRGGSYRLRFVALENSSFVVEKNFHVERDTEGLYNVELISQKIAAEERELEEESRKQYLRQLPDDALIPTNISKGNWQYLDREGKAMMPFIYNHAYSFHEGLASVEKKGKWGYIDKAGIEIISIIYDEAYAFHKGLAKVCKDNKWGYINKDGKEVISIIYDAVSDFSEGVCKVLKNGKYGYIDKTGREVTPLIYDGFYSHENDFHEGMSIVLRNRKYGYINIIGREVIPLVYDHAWAFRESLALVGQNGKYGFVDKVGREVIPLIFNHAMDFSEGRARVEKDGKYGYVDKSGRFMEDNWIRKIAGIILAVWKIDDWRLIGWEFDTEKDGSMYYVDKTGKYMKYNWIGRIRCRIWHN